MDKNPHLIYKLDIIEMVAISKGPAFNNEHENVRLFKRDYFEEEHLCYTVKVIQYDFTDTANLLIFIEVILFPEFYKYTGIKGKELCTKQRF